MSQCLLCRPEDFVVTELDSDGGHVTVSGSTSTTATVVAPQGGREPPCDQKEAKEAQTNRTKPPPANEEPLDDHLRPHQTGHCHLDQLVSDDIYQQLVSMAASCCDPAPAGPPSAAISLGI